MPNLTICPYTRTHNHSQIHTPRAQITHN
jgi:hypothetical protein